MNAPAMVLLAATPVLASQIATFSGGVEAVRVDALVTNNGRPVNGLRASDFDVRDNGVVQRVELVSVEQLSVDVVLALDVSDSVTGERLRHLQTAGRSAVKSLKPGDRSALLSFNHAVTLNERLTGDAERVARALDSLAPTGRTSLVDAAYAAILATEPSHATRNLVLMFSDGTDTTSWLTPQRVIDAARRSDATVYAVAAPGADRDFLNDLSEATGGAVVNVESTRDLDATFTRVLDEFRKRYVLSFSPSGVNRGGWHRLEVRVKGRRVDVRARQGYQGGLNTPGSCTQNSRSLPPRSAVC